MVALCLDGQRWIVKDQDGEFETRVLIEKVYNGSVPKQTLCKVSGQSSWQTVEQCFSFLGPYAILEKIGVGAFGVVFLAVHAQDITKQPKCRLVALKSPTTAFLDRFINEAREKQNEIDIESSSDRDDARTWAKLKLGQLFSNEASITARFDWRSWCATDSVMESPPLPPLGSQNA